MERSTMACVIAHPLSLQDICINYIVENVYQLCYIVRDGGFLQEGRMSFKSPVFIHEQIADKLFARLTTHNQTFPSQLISLFSDSSACRLRNVHLKGDMLSKKGILPLLASHKLHELELMNVDSLLLDTTAVDLVGLPSQLSLQSLRISNTLGELQPDFICMFPALRYLDVSHTSIDDMSLSIICSSLPQLESLNVSNSRVKTVAFPNGREGNIKCLSAYETPMVKTGPIELQNFTGLVHLDISCDIRVDQLNRVFPPEEDNYERVVENLLKQENFAPKLAHLDVSGTKKLAEDVLKKFLADHDNLKFLGLYRATAACYYSGLPDIQVTGEANEKQLLLCFSQYWMRINYMICALRRLFTYTQGWVDSYRGDVLRLVLLPMRAHPQDERLQMASTACIYNLTRHDRVSNKVPLNDFSEVLELTLKSMQNFSQHEQIQKNCLLTIYNHYAFHTVKFDKFLASKLALDALCKFSNDSAIVWLATGITAILSAKISTQETLALGVVTNMQRLLDIVTSKLDANQADSTLNFALGALWNLTDEAPTTCETFVHMGGVSVATRVIQVFHNKSVVQRKVLGLMNNIAEVKHLRHLLLTEEFVRLLSDLLGSDKVDVSYFAAGILCNLVYDWPDTVLHGIYSRKDLLQTMATAVMSWENPSSAMVAYRSFSPFLPMLVTYEMPEVQLWSVWAIKHVCSRNAKRYLPLLHSDGIFRVLLELLNQEDISEDIKVVTRQVVQIVSEHEQFMN